MKVRRAIAISLCLPGLLGTYGAWAQGAPTGRAILNAQTTVDPLTVVARRKLEAPRVQALSFVQSHGAPTKMIGQLARWTSPVCPVTMGLSPDVNAFVSARVTAIATEIGATVAKQAHCKPNIEILFTDDPQALVNKVARKQSAFLGYHEASQAGAMEIMNHPVQAWYLTGVQNDKGARSVDVATPPMASELAVTQTNGGLQAMQQLSRSPPGCPGSHFTQCKWGVFVNVLIVADARSLDGRPIGPIADYIGLLALSQSRSLEGCEVLPSILDLLSSACSGRAKSDSLTKADIAYLKALYRLNLDTNLSVEMNELADNMAQNLRASPSK